MKKNATSSTQAPALSPFYVDEYAYNTALQAVANIVEHVAKFIPILRDAGLDVSRAGVEGLKAYSDPETWRRKCLVTDYQNHIAALPATLPLSEKERIFAAYKKLFEATKQAVETLAADLSRGLIIKDDDTTPEGWSVDVEEMEKAARVSSLYEVDAARFAKYYNALAAARDALAEAQAIDKADGTPGRTRQLQRYIFSDEGFILSPEKIVKHTNYRV